MWNELKMTTQPTEKTLPPRMIVFRTDILALFASFFCLGITGCSLDDQYFKDRTQTSAYVLGTSVIPAAKVQEVSFTSNGNTIYGEFVTAQSAPAPAPTILYVHGDDKNITKFWPRIEALYPLNTNIFIFDFQGYGKSTGSPTISGITQNTIDALAYLKSRPDVNLNKLIYYAYSIGGVFATRLASSTNPQPLAVIYECIPASSDSVVYNALRVDMPSSFVFDGTFNNLESIHATKSPTLILHAVNDESIPFDYNAPPVFAAANQPKQLVPVPNAGHSDVITALGETQYSSIIQQFLTANGF
jgi:pimeloyl-ACP methyl ester carboxylesterase